MTTIPAITINGLTRPELHLDAAGNIVLDPAAAAFVAAFGLKALYLGCPPNTPFPPVAASLSTPVDANPAANSVLEGAAVNTPVNLTVSATSSSGTVTYALTADTSNGGFKIDPNTGVVTVANSGKIDFEANAAHAYTVTVQASDGVLTSSQNFTINVGNVNEAPSGASKTVATTEDQPYTFTVADFGFTDPDIFSANALKAVKITTLPAGATLTLNDNAVAAGDFIPVAEITAGHLVLIPAADASGAPLASFTFQVQDNGGTANGGVDTDPTPRTMTLNVTAVNDAPSFTVGANQAVLEDSGAHTVNGFASNLSDGPNETGQALNFLVSNDNNALFLVQPSIDANGNLTYTPAANANGSATVSVRLHDNGGTANGGIDTSAVQTFTISVAAVNDAPAGTDKTVTVFGAHTIVAADFGFSDPTDAASTAGANHLLAVEITSLPASGTLTLNGNLVSAGQFVTVGDINSGLLVFTPSGSNTGSFTFQVQDDGGTANGGADTDSTPHTLTIAQDALPLVTAGHTLNYTENQGATAIDPAIAVSDTDNASLASATVQITGNYVLGQDVLGFTNQNGITGSFNAATGTLTLTGSSSVTNYQAALASVTYVNTSDNPSGLARTVTIIANDGTANSIAATDTITVKPVNDAPATTAGGTLNYFENQPATAIDPSVNVTDIDSANMSGATVQITGNYINGQDILGFTNQNGITGSFNAATGTLTLSGSSSITNYKAALDSVTYFNTSDTPSGLDRTVSYTVNDGAANSNISTSTIHVTPVNDAPIVTIGAITGFTEPPNGTPAANSTPVTIAPSLTVSDIDSGNLTSATLVLNNAKPSDALSISGHAGASGDIGNIHFVISSSAGTETVTLTGTDTIAHYNAVLDLVQFNNTSEAPDTTARSYTVTAVDDGGTANGGNNTGSATASGTVAAVNDAPTVSVPADTAVGTAFSHTDLAISGLSVADDAGNGNVTATISATHASLSFDTSGLAGFTNNGSHTVTLTGTVAEVNAALASLTYNSDDGFTGSDTVTLAVNDNGNTGSGGPLSSGSQSFHVGVVTQVFFIDNSAVGSANLGTKADPFTSIAAFNAANPASAGEYVVLEHGTGTYAEANGINLADGVNLIGGSHTLQFTNPVTGAVFTANAASGTDPVIKVTGSDNGIDLLGNSGHSITGISVDTSTSTGNGISDDGFNVGTVTMSDITVKTAGGTGLSFTHGGTITVTGAANSITSGTGTALDIENTNIGAGNATFRSISSTGGSADGIILINTGASGGLHVTGDGATAGSGGTIANKSGADGSLTTGNGILLSNTNDVQLAYMQLNDFDNFAIHGNNVTGFTLDHSVINGDNGTSNSTPDTLASSVSGGEDALRLTNLHGTNFITNSAISGGFADTVHVENRGSTLTMLTVDHSTIGGRTDNGTGMNDGIDFQADTSGTVMNITVTNSALTTARANLFAAAGLATGTTLGVTFDNNIVTNDHPQLASGIGNGGGIEIASFGNVTYDISNNTFDMHAANGGAGINTHVVTVIKATGSTGTFDGTIAGNTIGVSGVAHSGSGSGADDIHVESRGTGTNTVLIQNNTLFSYDDAGITLVNTQGSNTLNATVGGNVTTEGGSNAVGLFVDAGTQSSDTGTINVKVGGAGTEQNDFSNSNPSGFADVALERLGNTTLNLSQGVSSSSSPVNVVQDNNLNPSTTLVSQFGTANVVASTPPLPLLAADGGVHATSPTTGEMHLTQAELNSVVSAAIAGWAAAGATAAEIASMQATTFSIADLAGSTIGDESQPSHITIDVDAAGHGWYVDPTPSDNFEFTHAGNAGGTDLFTDPTSTAAGHLDLLTTVMHELGHVIGLSDKTASSAAHDLMYVSLVDGERRLPDAGNVADANGASFSFHAVGAGAPAATQTGQSGTPDSGHSFNFAGGLGLVALHADLPAKPPVPPDPFTGPPHLFTGLTGSGGGAGPTGDGASAPGIGTTLIDNHMQFQSHADLFV